MRRFWSAGLLFLMAGAVFPQAVVSTHSGVLNFSEGEIFFDDQPVNQKPGAFPSLHDGGILRTDKGRAEVLLTPGVFLRVDENSSFKLVSSSLSDTRVEVLTGSTILDSSDAAKTDGLAVLFRAYQIHFPERGVYRISTEPGVLQPYSGMAEVSGDGPAPVTVDETHQYFLDVGLKTERYGDGLVDQFTEWARTRSETISADNAAAAASAGDPGDLPSAGTFALGVDPGLGGSPGIGVPGVGSPVYPPLGGSSPLYLNNGLYPYGSPFLGVPGVMGYPLITTWIMPVAVYGGRWPRPGPRPIYPGRGYPHPIYPVTGHYPPPGLSSIINGRRPVAVQPVRPVIGVRPVSPIGGVRSVAPRPAMPTGIRAIGHR